MGLRERGLLEIIDPEKAVDKSSTEQLASTLSDIIASGVLDELSTKDTSFHEISMSRLGSYGDRGLFNMIFEELKNRGLARDSEDGVSVPMHPILRSLVLVLLSQILRPYGTTINANLSPVTDLHSMIEALSELLSLKSTPSSGSVVEFDLNVVSVDLGSIPLDEVLDFRQQNLAAHKRYMLSVRKFAMELSRMSAEEQDLTFEIRQAELDDLANDLRIRARKAWRKPASFALSLAGSVISVLKSPIAEAIKFLERLTSDERPNESGAGAYSYLFRAHGRWGRPY